jgi:hypothetical protein
VSRFCRAWPPCRTTASSCPTILGHTRRLGSIGGLPGAAGRDPFRPLAAPSCALRLRSGEGVPMATAIISGGRAFRTATPVFSIPQWSLFVGGAFAPNRCPDGNGHRFGRKSLQSATPVSSIPQWSRLKPLLQEDCFCPRATRRASGRRTFPRPTAAEGLPIEIGLQALAPGVGLRRRKRHLPVGAGHRDGGLRMPQGRPFRSIPQWSRLKPLLPIEIGLPGRCAPGVGLRRRKRHLPGRRRPTVGRRPLEAEFIRRAGRPPAEGLHAD